jgi:hypothetical protein
MKKRALAWTAVGVMLVAVLWVAWKPSSSRSTAPDPMALKPPVATVRFADASRLEIFGLSEGEWVDGILSKPAGGWNSSSGMETSAFGDERDFLTMERFRLKEKLAGVRYLPGEGRLVMSLRLLDASGGPVSPEKLTPSDLKIRLWDGAGELINGSGPFGADDDPDGRGVVSFSGWPRGEKELVFRAQRAGQPAVEFWMPNPAAGLAPVVWTPTPLPQTRSGDYWKMSFSKAWEATVPGKGRCVVGEIDFHSDLWENGRFSPIRGWTDAVQGARGTYSGRSNRLYHSGKLVFGHPMPPDEDQFKFLYRIRYSESYPYPRAGVSFCHTGGVVSPDGKRIERGSMAKKLGLESFTLGPIVAKEEPLYRGSHQFAVSFEGTWESVAERSAAEAAWGIWKDWTPVVFLNGEDRSLGAVQFKGSGLSSEVGAASFQWSGIWVGELKPGDKVEIGVMPRRPDEVLEFVVDRTALSPE